MKPILFILSGLPGSGKSTLSRLIAKKYNALYLRIDTIEQCLRDLCSLKVESEGYKLSYRIAEDNLKLGLNIVADSCNSISLTRKDWENVAKTNDATFINIEISCSDKNELRKRVETRITDIDNFKLPTWADVENREYDVWEDEVIRIDTANKSIEVSSDEIGEKINHFLECIKR